MATAPSKVRLEIEIEVLPWSNERIAEESNISLAEVESWGDEPEAIEVGEIADCLVVHLNDADVVGEALAGSCLYYDLPNATLVRASLAQGELSAAALDLLEELEQQADGCSTIIGMLEGQKSPVAVALSGMLSIQEGAARAAIAKARGEAL